MTDRDKIRMRLMLLGFLALCLVGLPACQTGDQTLPEEVASPAAQSGTDQSEQPSSSDSQTSSAMPTSAQGEAASNTGVETDPAASEDAETTADPAIIQASWQSSPHANSFVLDTQGQNNTCARCHAPINWMPSMDDLPESCFACKFELEDPPSFIPESDWTGIACNVCHTVDKKDNIQPEYAWLEIAPLGEYAAVASPTELCLKCHAPLDIPKHGDVLLGGDHADYECTGCHSAHDTTASCAAVGCHNDVIEPATPIPGHDADHRQVSCVACHDGSGMEVGPDEETGLWTTFISDPAEAGAGRYPFTSHNIILRAPCDRCHFVSNSWGLSDSVAVP